MFVAIIITSIVATTTTIFAYSLIAENVGFTPKDTTWEVENVDAAVNDLYAKANRDLLNRVYPIGSIYLSISDTNPSVFIGGEWEQVSEGRTLFGAGELNNITYTAGNTINAGLPNITGNFGITANGARGSNMSVSSASGAFYSAARSGWRDGYTDGYNSNTTYYAEFNASRSSSIYGNSTTVQPNAYVVYMFKRIK